VTFIEFKSNPFALGYSVKFKEEEFIILFNADTKSALEVKLPEGDWDVLVEENIAGIKVLKTIQKKVTINSSTGMVLKKNK